MTNRRFLVFLALVLFLGAYTGYHLSSLPKIEPYKLLNIVGLFYDLLGVVVLSDLLASAPKWKRISLDWIAPGILWFHSMFPFGVLPGAGLAHLLKHAPSSGAVAGFAFGFAVYSMIPLSIFDMTVSFPTISFFKDAEYRWRMFAFFLVLSGVGLQLLAAIKGFQA